MAECGPYNSNASSVRGETDTRCAKNWQVVKTQQGVPTSVFITIDDAALTSIPLIPPTPSGTSTNATIDPFTHEYTTDVANNYIGRFFFREHPSNTSPQIALVTRQDTDTFVIDFDSGHLQYPGLYIADLALYGIYGHTPGETDSTEYLRVASVTGIPNSTTTPDEQELRLVWFKRMYLEIEPNNSSNLGDYPLTIAEVRLAMRDECAESNFLIDDLEFTDKEIAYAIKSAVDYWNETPPPVCNFTYGTFPFRFHWKQAVMGLLLRQGGVHKLRNWLPYTGGGVNVNDQAIWQHYMSLGNTMWDEYRQFVQNKKVEINITGSFSGLIGGTPL